MAKQKAGSRRHKTIMGGALKRTIATLGTVDGVDRVTISRSKGVRHGCPVGSIKLQSDTIYGTGIRIIGYSDRGITEFAVITSNIEATRAAIKKKFDLD